MKETMNINEIVNISEMANMSKVVNISVTMSEMMNKEMDISDIVNMGETTSAGETLTLGEPSNPRAVPWDCRPEGAVLPDDPPLPRPLIVYAMIHCWGIVVLGSLSNGVALWCVATCNKTRVAVKLLLHAVFLPVLLICLTARPLYGLYLLTLYYCDPRFIPDPLGAVALYSYSFLAQMELAAIAVIAVVRAVAVWSRQRYELKLKTAIAIVVCLILYSLATCIGLLTPLILGWVKDEALSWTFNFVYFFLNVMLPCIITASSYAAMMLAVRLNKRRLGQSGQQGQGGSVVDQATRAILALFISSLIFGLPHAIYHLLGMQPLKVNISFHILFHIHFVVDPVVFVWFNKNYRERVLGVITGLLKRVYTSSSKQANPSIPLAESPSTSSDTNKGDTNKSDAGSV